MEGSGQLVEIPAGGSARTALIIRGTQQDMLGPGLWTRESLWMNKRAQLSI